MQSFLKLLRGSGGASPPLEELVTLAGRLCRDLQNDPSQVQALVSAMLDNQQHLDLLNNKDVVMVCARVLAQLEQHQAACKLLEGCRVSGDTQQLVKLWNDIHYHLVMKRRGLARLTARQKFYYKKRNPPPPSLCPDVPKNQHYPREVRLKLEDFATSVSEKPSLVERYNLAAETSLTTEQIKNWFSRYRQKRRTGLQHIEQAQDTAQYLRHPAQHGNQGSGPVHQPPWSGGEENRPAQSVVTTQGPWEPLALACIFSGDKKMPKPQTPRNPPPPFLCPAVLKNQRYPREVRRKLEDFASSVSNKPSPAEWEILAAETSLTRDQVCKWFRSYRWRERRRLQRIEQAQDTAEYPQHPAQHGDQGSSREASSPTGQLVHSHGLDLTVCPADASVAMSVGTPAEPSPRGLGCTTSDPDPFQPASGSGLSNSAGFTDPPNCAPQSTYLEEGLGASINQAGQAGNMLATQSPPPAPESLLPESPTELAPAGPGPVVELSEPPPSSHVVLSEDETWAFFVTPGSAHAFDVNQPAKNEPGCGGPKDGREVVQQSGLQRYLLGGQSTS